MVTLLLMSIVFVFAPMLAVAQETLRPKEIRAARLYATNDLAITGFAEYRLDEVLQSEYRGAKFASWLLVYKQTDEAVSAARDGRFFRSADGIADTFLRLGACSLMSRLPGLPRIVRVVVVAVCWVVTLATNLDRRALDYQSRLYNCLRDQGISAEDILKWSDQRDEKLLLQPLVIGIGKAGWLETAECEPSRRGSKPFFVNVDPHAFYEQAESVWWVAHHEEEYHNAKVRLRETILSVLSRGQ